MSEWKEYRLKDITTKIGSGSTPTGGKDAYFESGITLIRSLNVYDFTFEYKDLAFINEDQAKKLNGVTVQKEDILLNITGASVGRCTIVPEHLLPARVNQHVSIIRGKKDLVNAKFLLYCINSKQYKDMLMTISGSGATREALTKEDIENFKILLPSIQTQHRIASTLSAYDDLIENNNRRIALLEQMAEQIYKEWFVRMRFPGYENMEFEKGVPKGWLKELGEYISVIKGKSYTGEEINEIGQGKPFVNLKSFNRGGGYRYDGIKFYTGKYHNKQVVKEGDIVMAVTDMTQERLVVGRVARIPKTEFAEMVISLDAAKLMPIKKIPNSFFYATLRFGFFGDTIKEFANGANVLHLKPEVAYKMKSIIPDDEGLIRRFDEIVEPMFATIDKLNLKNQILINARDLLLPRLISGKLKVNELKEFELE